MGTTGVWSAMALSRATASTPFWMVAAVPPASWMTRTSTGRPLSSMCSRRISR
jgi:hypothetical protein